MTDKTDEREVMDGTFLLGMCESLFSNRRWNSCSIWGSGGRDGKNSSETLDTPPEGRAREGYEGRFECVDSAEKEGYLPRSVPGLKVLLEDTERIEPTSLSRDGRGPNSGAGGGR